MANFGFLILAVSFLMFLLLRYFFLYLTNRADSHYGNNNGTELMNNGYKSTPTRNNSSGLLPDPSSLTSTSASSTTTAKPGYASAGSLAASELSKRISSTLARHGIEEPANKRNSYVDNYSSNMGTGGKENSGSYKLGNSSNNSNNYSNGDYTSNSMSWRRKLDEDSSTSSTPDPVTEKKMVVSRATSPQPDVNKQFRTRIARTTDPIYVEKRRSRQPRAYDVACQTDPNSEFGLLSEYLRKV